MLKCVIKTHGVSVWTGLNLVMNKVLCEALVGERMNFRVSLKVTNS